MGPNVDVGFAFLGKQKLKNIESPINVYKVLLDPKDAGKTLDLDKSQSARWAKIAAAGVALFLAATIGFAIWQRPTEGPPGVASDEELALTVPAEPSIAVLSFKNLSGKPEDDYFSDGITEDIITELARNQDLFVIARHSSFRYKGTAPNIQDVGRELGVRYVLDGSVRRAGENIRVTVQLVNASTGRNVWAESYDRESKDLFNIQEDVIRNIVGVLLSQVRAIETAEAFAKPTEDLRAYDLLKQGIELKHRFTKETSLQAREVLSKAIELDPGLAEAWVYLGYTMAVDYGLGLTGAPQRAWLDSAVQNLQKAIALKPSLSVAYQALNYTLLYRGDMDEALVAGRKSVELNPNDSENWLMLGKVQSYIGDYQNAVASAEKAMRLNPFPQVYYLQIYSDILYAAGKHEKGAEIARSCTTRYPTYWKCRLILAAHLADLGELDSARGEMEILLRQKPRLSREWVSSLYHFREGTLKNKLLGHFQVAGLPDKSPVEDKRLPSVAVLPFDNMSGDPELDYFSDGVTEDIITALAQDPYLGVTARNSTFKYRGEAVDVRKVGSELGVGYVLEGSVRKVADTVRITAQLIDAKTGDHIWADRYDEEGADVFRIQDNIASKISATLLGLGGVVQRHAEKTAWRNKSISLEEYDYLLRGHAFWVRYTKKDMAEARRVFSEGLERFPGSGLLRIKIGWTLMVGAFWGWSDNPEGDLDRAFELAREGMEDPDLPRIGEWYGHFLLAWLYVWRDRDFDRAISEADATLAIAPNHPDSLTSLCMVFLYGGQPDVCQANLDKAMSPSGKPPWWFAHRYYGWAHYLKDQCGDAIEHLAKITKRDINTFRLRAACYARLGNPDLAQNAVAEILSSNPNESLSSLRKQLPYRNSEDLERLLADLRKAGLPEAQSKTDH